MIRSFDGISSLTLGTAQLGLEYGIANTSGTPDEAGAERLLDVAWNGGVRCFDTARAYGDAEARIGRWLKRRGHPALVVSKLPRLSAAGGEGDAVRANFALTCAALGREDLDGYLCHDASDIRNPNVATALATLRDAGRIGAFGISAYEPADVDEMLSVRAATVIQMPVSVFNQAMITSGCIERCAARGITVFARSVFVQGLALMDPQKLPAHLAEAGGALAQLRALAREAGTGLASMLLRAIRDLSGVASVVAGAETPAQAAELAAAAAEPPLDDHLSRRIFAVGRAVPREIANPQLWPQRAG